MCLLVLAWRVHPRYKLVVAANRDEFHERPTEAMSKWPAPDDIIAGRDLRAGGTWLAMDRDRRFGIVTNFRELQPPSPGAPSRGNLIPNYLRNPAHYLQQLEPVAAQYSGFNLLLADRESLWYVSNRAERFAQPLPPGIYGLSNELLDTPWPKLQRVRRRFDPLLTQPDAVPKDDLFAILADPTQAGVDEALPETGLSREWEQLLSSPFISTEDYGTRCSTIVMVETSGAVSLTERRFGSRGIPIGETEFVLGPGEWPKEPV
ncbi:MAG TPA: NRDE family protein [Steroidobacteraceae bacterium]|nr:NRDE family protein [Steroidobacteraceae bacterium]